MHGVGVHLVWPSRRLLVGEDLVEREAVVQLHQHEDGHRLDVPRDRMQPDDVGVLEAEVQVARAQPRGERLLAHVDAVDLLGGDVYAVPARRDDGAVHAWG